MITCVLFNGKFVDKECHMPEWLPVIRQPKPVDLVFHPKTYYSDFRKIESIDYEYVGKLPDGRYLYALNEASKLTTPLSDKERE